MEDREAFDWHLPQTKGSASLKSHCGLIQRSGQQITHSRYSKQKGILQRELSAYRKAQTSGADPDLCFMALPLQQPAKVRACSCLITHTVKQVTRQWGLGPAAANIHVCQSLLGPTTLISLERLPPKLAWICLIGKTLCPMESQLQESLGNVGSLVFQCSYLCKQIMS